MLIESKIRTAGLITVATALSAIAIVGFAGSRTGEPEKYGPYHCKTSSCLLQTPMLDAGTAAFIDHYDNQLNGNWYIVGGDDRVVNDQFIVCNSVYCVTYTRTHSGGFVGDPAVPITQHGDGGSNSPPPGLGGDGIPGAGSGGGGCTVCEPDLEEERWGNVGDVENIIDP